MDYPPDEDPEPDDDATPWPYELYQLIVAYHHAPVPGLQHAEIGRQTIDDLGPVIAYDAAQDPEACAADLGSAAGRSRCPRSRGRGVVPAHRGRRTRPERDTGPVHRAAVQHLGDVRRGGHDQVLPPDRAGPQPRHRGARRAGPGRGRRRRPSSTAGSGPAGGRTARRSRPISRWRWRSSPGPRTAGDSPWTRCGPTSDFAEDAAQLGRALAEIHAALRDAFPTAEVDGTVTETIMNGRLTAAALVAPDLDDADPRAAGRLRRAGRRPARHPAGAR